jgi:hypothetical protein
MEQISERPELEHYWFSRKQMDKQCCFVSYCNKALETNSSGFLLRTAALRTEPTSYERAETVPDSLLSPEHLAQCPESVGAPKMFVICIPIDYLHSC